MKDKNNTEWVKAVYIYFFLAVGLSMMVGGFFLLSQALVKQLFLPKYPLTSPQLFPYMYSQISEESRCDYLVPPFIESEVMVVPQDSGDMPLAKPEEGETLDVTDAIVEKGEARDEHRIAAEKQKEECVARLDEERNVRRTSDFGSSIAFIVIGALVFSYHRKALRRNSVI